MKQICSWGYWSLVVSAMILSPIVVILMLPLAIGIGLDVFDAFGKMPIVVALCAPVAIGLLRHLSAGVALRRAAAYLWARAHIANIASLTQAL